MTALDKLIEAVEAGSVSNGVSGLKAFEVLARAFLDLPSSNAAFRAYHGSLDAALALHEALLPGWFCQMSVWSMHEPQIVKVTVGNDYIGTASTPAHAWLIAILRAYRSAQQ